MAAAVRGAGGGIGERMLGGAQAVELADEGEPRPGGMAGESPFDAGERKPGARLEPQCRHALRDESGGLHFVEAGLGVAQDGFTEIDDRVRVAIDRIANGSLQFILAAHLVPPPSVRRLLSRHCREHRVASNGGVSGQFAGSATTRGPPGWRKA